MIVEYIRYTISPDAKVAFEEAYQKAQAFLKGSPHCLGYELARCVEEPQSYVLRIMWDSLDGHEKGFRTSSEFPQFLSLVRPYLGATKEMHHYEATSIKWKS